LGNTEYDKGGLICYRGMENCEIIKNFSKIDEIVNENKIMQELKIMTKKEQ
jgi:hypothetical protein